MINIILLALALLCGVCGPMSGPSMVPHQIVMTTKKSVAPAPVAPAPAPSTPAAKIEVPREVDVQTKLEAAQQTMVEKLGREIITTHGELAGKYLQLCLYIRQQKVAPKLVAFTLQNLGFKRSRISEVNRVANASDKLFKEYEAKLIGFDKCLEMARFEKPGTLPSATPAAQLLVSEGSMTSDEADAAIKAETTPADASGAGPKVSLSQKLKSHASWLAHNATKSFVYRFSDAKFEVEVRKSTPPPSEKN